MIKKLKINGSNLSIKSHTILNMLKEIRVNSKNNNIATRPGRPPANTITFSALIFPSTDPLMMILSFSVIFPFTRTPCENIDLSFLFIIRNSIQLKVEIAIIRNFHFYPLD